MELLNLILYDDHPTTPLYTQPPPEPYAFDVPNVVRVTIESVTPSTGWLSLPFSRSTMTILDEGNQFENAEWKTCRKQKQIRSRVHTVIIQSTNFPFSRVEGWGVEGVGETRYFIGRVPLCIPPRIPMLTIQTCIMNAYQLPYFLLSLSLSFFFLFFHPLQSVYVSTYESSCCIIFHYIFTPQLKLHAYRIDYPCICIYTGK